MASTIVTKNSSTASAVPLTGDLTQGELAVNVTDKRLFTKNSGGTVVELGTNPASLALPNGTANGVAYLNGSKVVTSGSALTFDGTTFKASKAGTPFILAENTASATAAVVQVKNTAGSTYLGQDNVGGYLLTDYAAPLLFYINNSEAMRLTSTGLGIGTSSPAYKLSVNSGATTTIGMFTSTGSAAYLGLANSGATTYIGNDSTSGSFIIQTPSGGFSTKLTLDNSGNLGLGVTPSAWSSRTVLEVGSSGNAFVSGGAGDVYISEGAYYNAGWKYGNSSYGVALYNQYRGTHAWLYAPSGTAGNAITFTQAMTLDASGRLGIGETSPGQLLTIKNTSSAPYLSIIAGASSAMGILMGTAGNTVDGQILYSNSTQALSFVTASSERARIDSSGNLLVGTTSNSYTGGVFALSSNSGTTKWGVGPYPGSTSSGQFYVSAGIGTGVYLNSTSATSWSSNSDERLKTDLKPIEGAAQKVASLRAVTGRYKTDTEGYSRAFLIAQDVQAVLPEAVTSSPLPGTDDKTEYLSLAYTDTIPLLVAAIKEQQAIIEQLKADVAALKGN